METSARPEFCQGRRWNSSDGLGQGAFGTHLAAAGIIIGVVVSAITLVVVIIIVIIFIISTLILIIMDATNINSNIYIPNAAISTVKVSSNVLVAIVAMCAVITFVTVVMRMVTFSVIHDDDDGDGACHCHRSRGIMMILMSALIMLVMMTIMPLMIRMII